MKNVGQTIKKIRELKEMTREHVSDKLGIGVSGLAKIERGESEITISKLYTISEILGVGIHELLEFDVNKVFNISNNNIVQGTGAEEVTLNNHLSPHTEKYIVILEKENERLKMELESFKPKRSK